MNDLEFEMLNNVKRFEAAKVVASKIRAFPTMPTCHSLYKRALWHDTLGELELAVPLAKQAADIIESVVRFATHSKDHARNTMVFRQG